MGYLISISEVHANLEKRKPLNKSVPIVKWGQTWMLTSMLECHLPSLCAVHFNMLRLLFDAAVWQLVQHSCSCYEICIDKPRRC